jgi:formate hydrogenlyase subunit 3/multisubunit Na+/H+ antiporter MnhD subunit
MIALFIVLLVAALAAFILLRRRRGWLRYAVALTLFPGLPLLIAGLLMAVGDKAPPDSRVVSPEELRR